MPAGQRQPGMDQAYYDWSPMPYRPPFKWPDQARIALGVLVTLEDRVIDPPEDDDLIGSLGSLGGLDPNSPYPDLNGFTTAQYGLRNGIFRLMQVLDRFEIPTTVALDANVALGYPYLVQECRRRGWEFLGHGLMGNYPLTNKFSEDLERAYIQRALGVLTETTGRTPRGWFGTDYQESFHTLDLLAAHGIQYVLDWPNDEQPYAMRSSNGPLVSLPVLLELDDAYALMHRRVSVWRWEQMVKDAFDTLYAEAEQTGKLLILSLHPPIMGRAFRIRSLETVLEHICSRPGVWKARAGQIAAWFRDEQATST
jgi:allantoinase